MHKTYAKLTRAARAAILRQRLLSILGKRCAFCGNQLGLTFDCIRPQGDNHHRLNPLDRMYFYFDQNRKANVQILCWPCNVRKSNREQPVYIRKPAGTETANQ